MPTRPRGTWIRNTKRQLRLSTRKPASAGPAMAPRPTVLSPAPRALPRSCSGKMEVIRAIPLPWIMAAPTACRTVDIISITMFTEPPASAEPTTNMKNPTTYTCLRPIMSAKRPIGSSNTLMVRALAQHYPLAYGEVYIEVALYLGQGD